MLFISSFLACSLQGGSALTSLTDAEGDTPDGAELSTHDCEIVAAASSDVPTTWGATEVGAVLATVPSALTWTYEGPDPEALGDAALSLTVEVLSTEWIRREGSDVGSTRCRDGVELAVDAQWIVDVDVGEAIAAGQGTLYAASADAEHMFLDLLELSGSLSEGWQSMAEDSLSSEFGRKLTLQEAWIVVDGTWSAADVVVEGKFVSDANPPEGPRAALGIGLWSF